MVARLVPLLSLSSLTRFAPKAFLRVIDPLDIFANPKVDLSTLLTRLRQLRSHREH